METLIGALDRKAIKDRQELKTEAVCILFLYK